MQDDVDLSFAPVTAAAAAITNPVAQFQDRLQLRNSSCR